MGGGEIQDGKPNSENSGHPYSTESVEIGNSVDEANRDNGDDILDKLKLTIEKINRMIWEGAEITMKEFTEWGKTLKEIVEGESESATRDNIDSKSKEENGSKDPGDPYMDADKESGSDYMPPN